MIYFVESDAENYETWQQTADRLRYHLDSLTAESLSVIQDIVNKYNDYEFVAFTSTGKDSMVMLDLVQKVLPDVRVIFNNTSLDCAETYKMVKEHKNWEISNPPIGFYQHIKKYNYIPNRVSRGCCSVFKEGNSIEYFKNSEKLMQFMGVRNDESNKRTDREFISKNPKWGNRKWLSCLPICKWTELDIWLYTIQNNLEINPKYRKGYKRVGCHVACPYATKTQWLLDKYWYPKVRERWENILDKDFIENEEWCNGQWKQAISKDSVLQSKAPTKENVHALAELKGISDEMAKKYFHKTCSCGKKCNPTEVAMFYKTQGRMEGKEDNRTVLCQKCLCELMGWTKREYLDKANEFRDGGCNLF